MGSPNICQTPPCMILGTRSSAATPALSRPRRGKGGGGKGGGSVGSCEEGRNAKARRVRGLVGGAAGARIVQGGRPGPAVKDANPRARANRIDEAGVRPRHDRQ